MNLAECAGKWMDAIVQMLLELGLIALKEDDRGRDDRLQAVDFLPSESNGQMLLPGLDSACRRECKRPG